MAGVSCNVPIITLNTNGLSTSIKWQRLEEWIKKHDPTILCLKETHFNYYGIGRLKVKKMNRDLSCKY